MLPEIYKYMLIYTIYLANWSTSKILWSLTKEKYLERWSPHESIREKKPEDVFLCVKENLSNFLQSSFPDSMKTARRPITMLCIEKSEGNLRGKKSWLSQLLPSKSLKTWRDIHNVRSTSHLSFVYSLSLSLLHFLVELENMTWLTWLRSQLSAKLVTSS